MLSPPFNRIREFDYLFYFVSKILIWETSNISFSTAELPLFKAKFVIHEVFGKLMFSPI